MIHALLLTVAMTGSYVYEFSAVDNVPGIDPATLTVTVTFDVIDSTHLDVVFDNQSAYTIKTFEFNSVNSGTSFTLAAGQSDKWSTSKSPSSGPYKGFNESFDFGGKQTQLGANQTTTVHLIGDFTNLLLGTGDNGYGGEIHFIPPDNSSSVWGAGYLVPEPSSVALLAVGLGGVGWSARSRRRRAP